MSDFFDNNPEQLAIDPAYTGSRAEAIAEGTIIDVSDLGRQVGFKWPVAMTKAVWEDSVSWSDEDSEQQVPQNQKSRLFSVVGACADYVRTRGPQADRMRFRINRIPRDGVSRGAQQRLLQVVAHPGDDGEPVLTIRIPA
ncbi:MAG: hypothetical protein F4Z01_01540 [Gammaproteobacteria bacterium]|nr:hypothetical protein [Gammaproteobacteria bacterium]MYF38230.1 hypothetical protein [Gammaproteobacteria bacterium]